MLSLLLCTRSVEDLAILSTVGREERQTCERRANRSTRHSNVKRHVSKSHPILSNVDPDVHETAARIVEPSVLPHLPR